MYGVCSIRFRLKKKFCVKFNKHNFNYLPFFWKYNTASSLVSLENSRYLYPSCFLKKYSYFYNYFNKSITYSLLTRSSKLHNIMIKKLLQFKICSWLYIDCGNFFQFTLMGFLNLKLLKLNSLNFYEKKTYIKLL